jgi:hypothetical protein
MGKGITANSLSIMNRGSNVIFKIQKKKSSGSLNNFAILYRMTINDWKTFLRVMELIREYLLPLQTPDPTSGTPRCLRLPPFTDLYFLLDL